MRDNFKQLDLPSTPLEICPCCGSAAELWQYAEDEHAPTTKLVCCSNGDPIGPQEMGVGSGCVLYMPPNSHYCATQREAVKFWNEFAIAMCAMQRKNRWALHKVTRDTP